MKRNLSFLAALFVFLTITGCISGRTQSGTAQNPASYHYQMGLSYLGERNYSSALYELTEAEKSDPENADVLYSLGLAFIGKKRPDLAEAKLLKAVLLKPNFSAARNDLGVAYLDLKRWDSAIQQFKAVKEDLFYDSGENASINLGLAYLGKGDYSKALEELQAVAAQSPRNPVVRVSLGRVWFAMDKSDQAIVEYNRALQIYRDYGAAYYYLGQAQLKLNRIDGARSSFREAARLIPENELGRAAQGYLDLIK